MVTPLWLPGTSLVSLLREVARFATAPARATAAHILRSPSSLSSESEDESHFSILAL